MAKVLCTLPNASEEINGVKFASHANGMLSEEISDERAGEFASIPGYTVVSNQTQQTSNDGDKAAERAALLERAQAVGLQVKGNWGIDRLKAEVEAAEKAKADAEAAGK